MKVDVSRYFEVYDEKSVERLGKGWPIGMSVMPIAIWCAVVLSFSVILGIIPRKLSYKNFHADAISIGFYALSFLLLMLASYLSYDVYGNYLYYKGLIKNPPFSKSSLRQFWKDIRTGRKPFLILTERTGECTVFYFIYTRLLNRGVEVTVCNDELNAIGRKWINRLKEDMEQIKDVVLRYEQMGIKEMIVRYKDGKKIRLRRQEAELLGFLYYLGDTKYGFLANAEDLRKLRVNKEFYKKQESIP